MKHHTFGIGNRGLRLVATGAAAVMALGSIATAAQDTDTVRSASIHTGSCESPGDVVAELGSLVVMFDDDGNDDDTTGGSTPPASSGSDDDAAGDDNADDTNTDDTNTDDVNDDNADDADDVNDDDADDTGTRRPGTYAFQSGTSGVVGAEGALVVEGSEDSDIGVSLDTLVAEPHILAVFESDDSGTIIACGTIGGFVTGDDDDTLAVGLSQQNDSGYTGIALFDDADDDDELEVDVYIAPNV